MRRALVVLRMILARRMYAWYFVPLWALGHLILRQVIFKEGVGTTSALDSLSLASGVNVLFTFSTCFPLAMAVGITRRTYVIGNFLHHLQQTVYVTVLLAGLIALERATAGWFLGQTIFDGDHGSWWGTFTWLTPLKILVFLAVFTSARAFHMWRGMQAMLIYMVALGVISISAYVHVHMWYGDVLDAHFNDVWLAALLVVLTVLGLAITYLVTRQISVRDS